MDLKFASEIRLKIRFVRIIEESLKWWNGEIYLFIYSLDKIFIFSQASSFGIMSNRSWIEFNVYYTNDIGNGSLSSISDTIMLLLSDIFTHIWFLDSRGVLYLHTDDHICD